MKCPVCRNETTEEQERLICRLRKEGYSFKTLAKLFGITPAKVEAICKYLSAKSN